MHDPQFPIYSRCLQGRPGVLAFPSLRKLQGDARLKPTATILLPSSLRSLSLIFEFWQHGSTQSGEVYLLTAIDQARSLEELNLYGPVSLVPLARLLELKCLQKLELRGAELPNGAMTVLPSLPALTYLELPKTGWIGAPSMGFDHLESLTLSGRAPRVVQLLESLTTGSLRVITIRNSVFDMSPSSLTEWRRCFETIQQRFEPSLRSFDIEAVASHDGLSAVELFEPLMGLHQLEEFRLSELINLSVQDISATAMAWPHLRRLTLDVPPVIMDSNESTDGSRSYAIHCLTSLARHCPKLTVLNMAIGDHELPIESKVPTFSHGLTVLRLHAPHVSDYISLARLLHKVFPNLVEVRINDTFHDPPQGAKWRYLP